MISGIRIDRTPGATASQISLTGKLTTVLDYARQRDGFYFQACIPNSVQRSAQLDGCALAHCTFRLTGNVALCFDV